MKKRFLLSFVTLAVVLVCAQTVYAPKGKPAQYSAPHKPHTKLADLKSKHAGKKQWRELVVNDVHLRSEYIFAQPGYQHPRALHPDTREWWVILEGEVKFSIESLEPFTAKKGGMVQVPMQTMFSYEV